MPENLLNTNQAAVIAGKHQRTIVAWIRAGLLPAQKFPGGRGPYIIDKADLEKLIKEKSTPKPYVPEKQ
jgi:hypothetical protein